MKLVCGIDEAGRGPVIGPMVIAGVSMHERSLDELKELGVKDSKLLSPAKREMLYDKILRIVQNHHIVVISPLEIDIALGDPDCNLNSLEAIHQAAIIRILRPESVIVDCPSVNMESYSLMLKSYMSEMIVEIKAEHKADVNYPIVSAASIIAKVCRDREIEKIKKAIDIDFGSGYPSDPKTRKFLLEQKTCFDEIKRKSWKTYKKISVG
jgi:ribonuclease HII